MNMAELSHGSCAKILSMACIFLWRKNYCFTFFHNKINRSIYFTVKTVQFSPLGKLNKTIYAKYFYNCTLLNKCKYACYCYYCYYFYCFGVWKLNWLVNMPNFVFRVLLGLWNPKNYLPLRNPGANCKGKKKNILKKVLETIAWLLAWLLILQTKETSDICLSQSVPLSALGNWFVAVQLFSRVWLGNPMDYSMPGFPVLH